MRVYSSGLINFSLLENSNKKIQRKIKDANREIISKGIIESTLGFDRVGLDVTYVSSIRRKGRFDYHNFLPSVFFLSSKIFGKNCELVSLNFKKEIGDIKSDKCILEISQDSNWENAELGDFIYDCKIHNRIFKIYDPVMKNKILKTEVTAAIEERETLSIKRELIDKTNRHLYCYDICIIVEGDIKMSQTKPMIKKLIDKLVLERVIYDDSMVTGLRIIKRKETEPYKVRFSIYAKERPVNSYE